MSDADTECLVTPESPSSKLQSIIKWFRDLCEDPADLAAKIFVLLLCLLALVAGIIHGINMPDSHGNSYFGTYTSYEFVRGHIGHYNKNICQPLQIWMLARHGTAYPTKLEIEGILQIVKFKDKIISNHQEGSGTLKSYALKGLKRWHLDPGMRVDLAEHLARQGEEDMRSLADRLRVTFPELFNVTHIKNEDFIFRATNTPQTALSLKAFSQAVLKRHIFPVDPPEKDLLLKAYDNCPAWKERYYADHWDDESNQFAKGSIVQRTLDSFNERLGFNRTRNHTLLNYETMRSMYNLCRYETAFRPNNLLLDRSIWCDLFSDAELQVLEYQDDLDDYYYAGPGRQWNAKLGCHPLRDMYTRFRETVHRGTRSPKGVFYFAHKVTLQTMMAALGFDGGSSKPLKAQSIDPNRSFRTSLLSPFATNVIAVLHKCNFEWPVPYAVAFHTAERVQHIEGCAHDGLCDWNFIEWKFGQDVRKCPMDLC